MLLLGVDSRSESWGTKEAKETHTIFDEMMNHDLFHNKNIILVFALVMVLKHFDKMFISSCEAIM